jgi:hypothetical protein
MDDGNYFLIYDVTISYLFSLIVLGNKKIDCIFAQVLINKNQ